jgi:hypothetical protein
MNWTQRLTLVQLRKTHGNDVHTSSGSVTLHPLTFAEKATAQRIERAANRAGANVTAKTSTHSHYLLLYGRTSKCENNQSFVKNRKSSI